MVRYAEAAEREGTRMSHPNMRGLQTAVHLVGLAMQDTAWMQENDPGRELEGALKTLVRVTAPRPFAE